jgi:hypothetical protein
VRAKSFVICTILVAAFAQAAAAKPAVAPADEYFGRMKLSILGINNIVHDTKLREAYDPAHAADNFTKLSFAEDALEDWAAKYPGDNWLPGKAYFMSHEFWAMNTPDADRAAERCRALLLHRFAQSPYAVKAHDEIASMFVPTIATAVANAPQPAAGSGTAGAVPTAAVAGTAPSSLPPVVTPHS